VKKYYLWKGKTAEEIDAIYNDRLTDEYQLIEKDIKLADIVVNSTRL
jgi:hypothetical protein